MYDKIYSYVLLILNGPWAVPDHIQPISARVWGRPPWNCGLMAISENIWDINRIKYPQKTWKMKKGQEISLYRMKI